MRVRLGLMIFLLALPCATAAYDWEYLGMDGVAATTLTVDAERERVFVGTHEGFWIFDQVGGSWLERDDEGWIGRQVWAVDFDDDLPDRVITGRENAWWKGYLEYSDDLGATGEFVYESTGGRITDVYHDDAIYHFACTWSDIAPGELLRSDDGGESWTALAGHGFSAMTDLDRDLGGLGLVLAGDAGVKTSDDFGVTWQPLNGDLPGGFGVYCALGVYGGGDAIPPASLLVSLDPGLYYSELPGHWTQVLDVAGRRMVRLPVPAWLSPDRIAVVSWDGRVLVSQNFTAGWLDETDALPGTPVDLVYSPYDRGLYVLTAERGLYRHPQVVTAVAPALPTPLMLGAHPNPFNPTTTLRFTLPRPGRASLRLFDVRGRELVTLFDAERAAGEQSLRWNAGGLPSGVYLARLRAGGETVTARLVLLR